MKTFTLTVTFESYEFKPGVWIPITFDVEGCLNHLIPHLIYSQIKSGKMKPEDLKKMLGEYTKFYMAHLLGIEEIPIIEKPKA